MFFREEWLSEINIFWGKQCIVPPNYSFFRVSAHCVAFFTDTVLPKVRAFFAPFLRTLLQPLAQKIRLILTSAFFGQKFSRLIVLLWHFSQARRPTNFCGRKNTICKETPMSWQLPKIFNNTRIQNSWQYNENISFYLIKKGQLQFPPCYNSN